MSKTFANGTKGYWVLAALCNKKSNEVVKTITLSGNGEWREVVKGESDITMEDMQIKPPSEFVYLFSAFSKLQRDFGVSEVRTYNNDILHLNFNTEDCERNDDLYCLLVNSPLFEYDDKPKMWNQIPNGCDIHYMNNGQFVLYNEAPCVMGAMS